MRRIALLLWIALLASACGAQPVPSYAGTARHRYEQGAEALSDDDYLDAVKHFTYVKNKFAYSKYAALAEIGLADTYFKQKKYIEAIDAYRTFMQGRPNHQMVPTAMWRVGVAYYEQKPSDFFLFPPSHEKDLGSNKDALRALNRYVERFPKHEHVPAAKKKIADCVRELARYEMFVAKFYLRDDRPVSARGRLEVVVRDYAAVTDLWNEAALDLVEVYLELAQRQPEEAKVLRKKALTVARMLIEKAPGSDEAEQARGFLRLIGNG
jgi:outer membrane protein assembly factor BamD